ncbi:MAG: response regulator, partial [Lachnospiraceae bacterium]|nr:response regulator [Lachnospiraceae bacterium]
IGLGLSIVYGFVHAMGGFIKMESTPGQGTTVRLTIPQEVIDPSPCMSVTNPEQLSIACYLRSEKYRVPMVRDFYEMMISHLVRGLRIPLKRAASLYDLKTIAEQTKPTHIFTSQEEYEEDPAFFLQLSRSIRVIVVADQTFDAAESVGISILRKPFYGFPVASLLNTISISGGDDPLQAGLTVSFPGCKALVVDDEEMNLIVAKGIFTGYGMEVHTAASGRESIERYEREDFDIVFMDHMMPEMDGVEAMKALKQSARAKNRGTRFVALTANAVSGAREMFLSEGFDGFIPKPIVTTELEHLLRKILPETKIHYEKEKPTTEKEQLNKNLSGQALGIERCLGDRSLYRRLRLIFIEEMTHNLRVFRSAYATGTMVPYIARLRALRDGARIMGEDDLTRQARRLEQAIADLDAKRIDKEQEILFAQYRDCVERMKKAAQEGGDM